MFELGNSQAEKDAQQAVLVTARFDLVNMDEVDGGTWLTHLISQERVQLPSGAW